MRHRCVTCGYEYDHSVFSSDCCVICKARLPQSRLSRRTTFGLDQKKLMRDRRIILALAVSVYLVTYLFARDPDIHNTMAPWFLAALVVSIIQVVIVLVETRARFWVYLFVVPAAVVPCLNILVALWLNSYRARREADGGLQPLFRRGRHLNKTPVCSSCGYDLTGNVSGRCSECGVEIPR